MTDPTNTEHIERLSEAWWASRSPEIRARRCQAHRRNGDQCAKVAMEAQHVCGTHGGRAPQAKAKARRRIDEAADRMAARLLGFAENENVPAYVALAAVQDALDRAGMKAPTQVEVGVTQPYEQLMGDLAGIATITRAESLARRGLAPEPAALAAPTDPDAPIDAEVVDDPAADMGDPHPDSPSAGPGPRHTPDSPADRPAFASDDVGPRPGNALTTMEDAVAATSPRRVRSQRIYRRR